MVKTEMNSNKKVYTCPEWRDVDAKLRETQIIKEVIDQSVMVSNAKLKPFTNAGFNYKDRRKPQGKSTADPDEQNRLKIMYMRHRHKIDKYKKRLDMALKERDVFLIDEVLSEIAEVDDETELHHHLRLDIIKGQLCMQSYYKWRNEMRQYNAGQAKSMF